MSHADRIREATESCLSLRVFPSPSDRVFALPFYVVPVEIFTRGLFVRASYVRGVVLVDAVSAAVTFLKTEPSIERRSLRADLVPPRLTAGEAEEAARCVEVDRDRHGGFFRFSKISLVHIGKGRAQLVWRVWFMDENHRVTDATTGDRVEEGDLLALFLKGAPSSFQEGEMP